MAKGRNVEITFAGTTLARDNSLYSVPQFAGVEAEWARATLVGHPARGVNQVEAVGPCGISRLSGIPKLIEHRLGLDAQLAYTSASDEGPIFFTLRAGENHAVPDVALHLPDIAGVGFGDVDHDELDLVSIPVVELVQGRNLPPERRSGVAPEYQDDWPVFGSQSRQLNRTALVDRRQRKIGSKIALLQMAGAGARPQGFKREGEKRNRAWNAGHYTSERLGWLPHDRVDRTAGA